MISYQATKRKRDALAAALIESAYSEFRPVSFWSVCEGRLFSFRCAGKMIYSMEKIPGIVY